MVDIHVYYIVPTTYMSYMLGNIQFPYIGVDKHVYVCETPCICLQCSSSCSVKTPVNSTSLCIFLFPPGTSAHFLLHVSQCPV